MCWQVKRRTLIRKVRGFTLLELLVVMVIIGLGRLSVKGRTKLDDVELLAVIDDRLSQVLEYLDPYALSKMDGRNLMVAAGILIDKRQLLNDKPTAITQYSDLAKLDEVMADAMAELKRRGKLIDVTPGTAEPVANPGNSAAP